MQLSVILAYMKVAKERGAWLALSDIASELGYCAASVSAQLRNLRKPEHGAHQVEKRFNRAGRMWEYRLG